MAIKLKLELRNTKFYLITHVSYLIKNGFVV